MGDGDGIVIHPVLISPFLRHVRNAFIKNIFMNYFSCVGLTWLDLRKKILIEDSKNQWMEDNVTI